MRRESSIATSSRGINHVTPGGRAKVLDFGLARVMPGTASLTQSATISGPSILVGTVPYMSPEQVRDGRVDASSDLYALGVLLFEMTTGRRPFGGDDMLSLLYQIAHEPAPLLRIACPGLSAEGPGKHDSGLMLSFVALENASDE